MPFDFNARLQQQQRPVAPTAPTSTGGSFNFESRLKQGTAPVTPPAEKGFFSKMVGGAGNIVKDFFGAAVVKPAIRTSQAVAGLGINAFGNEEQKKKFDILQSRPTNVPFLGSTITVAPMKKGGSVNLGPVTLPGREIQTQVGDLAKTGSYFIGGGAAPGVIKSTVGGKVLQGMGQGFSAGLKGGAAYGFGEGMQDEDATLGSVAKETAIGGIVGAGTGTVLGGALPALPAVYKGASKIAKPGAAAGPLNTSIMKLSKPQSMKFKNIVGEEAGDWLAKRGITGTTDEISEKVADRFLQSRTAVDDALADIKGNYKDISIDSALNELVAREKRIAVPGLPGKDTARIAELATKNAQEGLTMSEINEVKRLFERQKLGYLKERNSDAIDKLTNIDTKLREWQYKTAEQGGFVNLQQLNKETQAAKELLNSLGKQYGVDKQTMLTLTDWIVLSGDPTGASVPAYLVKKFAGSQKLKAFLAKLSLKNAKILGSPASEFAPRLGLPAGNSAPNTFQNNVPIELPPRGAVPKGLGDEPPFFNKGEIPETMNSRQQLPPQSKIQSELPLVNNTTPTPDVNKPNSEAGLINTKAMLKTAVGTGALASATRAIGEGAKLYKDLEDKATIRYTRPAETKLPVRTYEDPTLQSPVTPDVKKVLTDGVYAEVNNLSEKEMRKEVRDIVNTLINQTEASPDLGFKDIIETKLNAVHLEDKQYKKAKEGDLDHLSKKKYDIVKDEIEKIVKDLSQLEDTVGGNIFYQHRKGHFVSLPGTIKTGPTK